MIPRDTLFCIINYDDDGIRRETVDFAAFLAFVEEHSSEGYDDPLLARYIGEDTDSIVYAIGETYLT